MPLLKIETRPKSDETSPPSRARRQSRVAETSSAGGVGKAIAAGALIGLLLIAGFAAFMYARSQTGAGITATQPGSSAGAVQADAPEQGSAPPQVAGGGDAGQPIVEPTPMLDPINADFPREAVVAVVNGEPYTMGQLETAVRVAMVLGTLSGDPVPAYGSSDMLLFQVRMLRRQVDMMLMKQALAASNNQPPEAPVDELIDAFLFRVGSTRGELERLMRIHGVTQDQLEAWFRDSTNVNAFVQAEIMNGADESQREALTAAWLDQQWDSQDIVISFYDPDTLPGDVGSPAQATTAPGAGGGDEATGGGP